MRSVGLHRNDRQSPAVARFVVCEAVYVWRCQHGNATSSYWKPLFLRSISASTEALTPYIGIVL